MQPLCTRAMFLNFRPPLYRPPKTPHQYLKGFYGGLWRTTGGKQKTTEPLAWFWAWVVKDASYNLHGWRGDFLGCFGFSPQHRHRPP
jgi:hypothetical protein